jgi:hypothetical protein
MTLQVDALHTEGSVYDATENCPKRRTDAVIIAPTRENMNSVEQDPGLLARLTAGKSDEDCKVERLDGSVLCPTHATSSMISYKAQNAKNLEPVSGSVTALPAIWDKVQEQLKAKLSTAEYETWIRLCRLDLVQDGIATLSVSSDFSRSMIAKRYNQKLQQAFSMTLGQPVKVRLQVDKSLESSESGALESSVTSTAQHPKEYNPKYPLARYQNPTNNPDVAFLLERYGDLREIILKSPIFKTPCASVAEGGWGTGVGGLINLAKQYTLERVLWAIRETKDYRGAREPGAYFNHIVRNGLEDV